MGGVLDLDPNITLARVRTLVTKGTTSHIRGLSEDELIDVVICLGALVGVVAGFLPNGMLDYMLTPVNLGDS